MDMEVDMEMVAGTILSLLFVARQVAKFQLVVSAWSWRPGRLCKNSREVGHSDVAPIRAL